MGRKLQSLLTLCLLAAFCCLMPQALAEEVLSTNPLDADLFVQGMEMVDGRLVFSSGLYESSKVGVLDLKTGQLEAVQTLPDHVFAEGLTETPAGIWLISWQEGEARLLDAHSLADIRLVRYEGEGWGICYDGQRLYMSDGSAWLTIRDADSFEVLDRVRVLIDGQPIKYLNELEYANGAIYANVLFSDIILKIDPKTGQTLFVIDMGWVNDLVFPKGAGGTAAPSSTASRTLRMTASTSPASAGPRCLRCDCHKRKTHTKRPRHLSPRALIKLYVMKVYLVPKPHSTSCFHMG